MMENRVKVALKISAPGGSFLCHADENEYERLKLMFDQFGILDAGTVVWDKRNPMTARLGVATQHEYIIWRSNTDEPIYQKNRNILTMLRKAREIADKYGGVTPEAHEEYAKWVQNNPSLTGGGKAYRFF